MSGNNFSTICLFLLIFMMSNFINAQEFYIESTLRQMLVEQTEFIQIPGPNPILSPGPKGTWDDLVVEASDAFEDLGIYYFYYHATKRERGNYRLGVASSNNPLGPFLKHGDKPILDLGPKGSWDDDHVACAIVVKGGDEKYYMWYSGCTDSADWSIGLATAEHPLGPWEKYEGNPVLKDFGYLGGVINVNRKWHIYSAFPIHMPWAKGIYKTRSLDYHSDYSPLALALGDAPEGPFKKYTGNPLMIKGQPGEWDGGGISEAEVLFDNGMFHMFYGGTRQYGPRVEDIGYAYSFDGFQWFKYGKNPVATHSASPNTAAFAEVHAIIELPYIYTYHTMRPEESEGRSHPWIEALGVQVLVTRKPFSVEMPALFLESLEGGKTTKLEDAPPIGLSYITRLSLTSECLYSEKAKKPIRIHVRGSYDGLNYDTTDLYTLDNEVQPGQLTGKTFELESKVRFLKVMVENLDRREKVSDLKIIVTLGG